ncbi:TetR/AcrR family transcriptional regulator [Streptomyces sp. NPDC090798]|uniref:TetR/AcrR family transcriptional regulator n=1 Tax=Streptomyces sp. NPDC090798 TaxID=3365968 RepID=UPI00381942A6
MPRPPDPAKRRDLLDQVREYMIRNGLTDLSLRPLARALGTSDRMLLYYFGSKERMVTEALALDERRPLLRARSLLGGGDADRDPAWLRGFMQEVWQRFSAPDLRAALPLYLEITVTGLLRPDRYAPVVRDALTEWKDLLTSVFRDMGLSDARARTEAVLLVDASFGMVVGPLIKGDWNEADAAFSLLLDRLEPGWRAT